MPGAFLVCRRRIAVFSSLGVIGFMGATGCVGSWKYSLQFVVTFFFVWFEYICEVFRKCVGFLFVALRPTVLRRWVYTQGGICWYRFPCCFVWLPYWVVVAIQSRYIVFEGVCSHGSQFWFKVVTESVAGHALAQLVEALRYKPEGRGFDSRWCHWIFFIDIILPATLWTWGWLSL